jgi:hypothetical protein
MRWQGDGRREKTLCIRTGYQDDFNRKNKR